MISRTNKKIQPVSWSDQLRERLKSIGFILSNNMYTEARWSSHCSSKKPQKQTKLTKCHESNSGKVDLTVNIPGNMLVVWLKIYLKLDIYDKVLRRGFVRMYHLACGSTFVHVTLFKVQKMQKCYRYSFFFCICWKKRMENIRVYPLKETRNKLWFFLGTDNTGHCHKISFLFFLNK